MALGGPLGEHFPFSAHVLLMGLTPNTFPNGSAYDLDKSQLASFFSVKSLIGNSLGFASNYFSLPLWHKQPQTISIHRSTAVSPKSLPAKVAEFANPRPRQSSSAQFIPFGHSDLVLVKPVRAEESLFYVCETWEGGERGAESHFPWTGGGENASPKLLGIQQDTSEWSLHRGSGGEVYVLLHFLKGCLVTHIDILVHTSPFFPSICFGLCFLVFATKRDLSGTHIDSQSRSPKSCSPLGPALQCGSLRPSSSDLTSML